MQLFLQFLIKKNAHFVFQANKVAKIKYISYIYLNLKYFF